MIINLISGPRNISTALMYSFAQRSDCQVWDEPFYANYNGFTQIADVKIRPITCSIDDGFTLPSIEQFEQLQAWVQGETDSWLLPTSGHVCYDRFEELLPLSADWMAAQLGVGTAINPTIMNDTL